MPHPPAAPSTETALPAAPLSSAQRWRLALHHSYPIAMGYVPAAIAYGVLMSAAGLPAWLAVAASVIVYSGAAQYAAVAWFSGGMGMASITFNTFIISLRHIFYAMPLLDSLPQARWERWYTLFALTDESFSVLTSLHATLRTQIMSRFVFCNQMYWVLGTAAGLAVGGGLNRLVPNLDFALNCLFAVLAYEQYRSRRTWWPCLLALTAFAAAKTFAEPYLLLAAVAFSIAFIICRSLLTAGKGAAP